jgi:hypothetical protein
MRFGDSAKGVFYFRDLRRGVLREALPGFSVVLTLCRFGGTGPISALSFPYLVIPVRSPRFARATNSSNLFFASVSPTVSMTLPLCNSNTTLR